MNVNHVEDPQKVYRILSIDGGGIRGVFPAAFLARIEEQISNPIGSYFDLIAGTSTGGIIAIALGLGLSATEILEFYENKGPKIFDQHHHPSINWIIQKLRLIKQLAGAKYNSDNLKEALSEVFGSRLLGESRTRLIIPAWHAETEHVYIYKTAHDERLRSDYRQTAFDAAMATAAAPTFLAPHRTSDEVELVDGGVWANNPIGVATVEAVGTLKWPSDRLKILSIGTISDVKIRPQMNGRIPLLNRGYVTHLFMAGQSHGAMGTAKILTGDVHQRKAIWRINQTAPEGKYEMDNASRILEMKSRANVEAREQFPELLKEFFYAPAEKFEPVYKLGASL